MSDFLKLKLSEKFRNPEEIKAVTGPKKNYRACKNCTVSKTIISFLQKGFAIPFSITKNFPKTEMIMHAGSNGKHQRFEGLTFVLDYDEHDFAVTPGLVISSKTMKTYFRATVAQNAFDFPDKPKVKAIKVDDVWYFVEYLEANQESESEKEESESQKEISVPQKEESKGEESESEIDSFQARHKETIVEKMTEDPELRSLALKKILLDLEDKNLVEKIRISSENYRGLVRRVAKNLVFRELEHDEKLQKNLEESLEKCKRRKREREEKLVEKVMKQQKIVLSDDELRRLRF